MTSYNSLQAISSRLSELTTLLVTSKLSKDELEEFEVISRKLYERAVILNYKAKEESVYGKSVEIPTTSIAPTENEVDELVNIVDSEMEAPVSEEESIELDEVNEENKDLVSEGLFSTEHESVRFDFSGGFDVSKTEEKTPPEEKLIHQQIEAVAINEITTKIKETGVEEQEDATIEPVAEKTTVDLNTSDSSLDHLLKENTVISDDKINSFYERFSKAYRASVGDRLGTSKINSLKEAIGLNDRLQFISELFGGDSAAYIESIEILDQLEGSEVALKKLSEVAATNNWNKEDAAVDEFAHFITRRYVD